MLLVVADRHRITLLREEDLRDTPAVVEHDFALRALRAHLSIANHKILLVCVGQRSELLLGKEHAAAWDHSYIVPTCSSSCQLFCSKPLLAILGVLTASHS